jgi:hypothetical protein
MRESAETQEAYIRTRTAMFGDLRLQKQSTKKSAGDAKWDEMEKLRVEYRQLEAHKYEEEDRCVYDAQYIAICNESCVVVLCV